MYGLELELPAQNNTIFNKIFINVLREIGFFFKAYLRFMRQFKSNLIGKERCHVAKYQYLQEI